MIAITIIKESITPTDLFFTFFDIFLLIGKETYAKTS